MNKLNQIIKKFSSIKVVCNSYLISLLFIISCPGQSLQEVFKDDLPFKSIKDESDLKNINYNLEYYSSIHPDLIFYYIRYLDNFINKEIKSAEINGLKELYKMRDYYLALRNMWSELQINNIKEQDYIRIKTNAMTNIFEDYLYDVETKEIVLSPEIKDSVEFYNYKFYTKNSEITLESTEDFYSLNLDYLESIASNINRRLTEVSRMNDEEMYNVLGEIIQFWYLFTPYENNKYQYSLVVDPFELSIKMFESEYYETAGVIFSAEYSLYRKTFTLFEGIFDFEDYVIPSFIDPLKYPFPARITQVPVFSLSFGYKFKLKNEIGFLSNLKTKVSYTYLDSDIEFEGANEEFYRFNYNFISSEYVETYVYYPSDFEEKMNYYFSAQITSTIFHWYKSLFFEFGFSLDYYIYKYSADVYRDDVLIFRPTGSETIRSTEKRGELLVKGSNFYFTPTLIVNYSPSNQLYVFSGLYLNKDFPRISLGLAYEF